MMEQDKTSGQQLPADDGGAPTDSVRKSMTQDTRWQAIMALTPDAIVCIDATSKLLEFNPAAEFIFGWKKEEVIGRSMVKILIPERYRMAHQEGLARFAQTGEARILNRHIEITALRRDGSEFPIELSITSTLENGCPIFTAYIRDIRERKKIEEELRIAATAFDSRESMFITDADSVIQRVNYAFTEVTGYSAEEAVGQKPSMLKSGRHDAEFYRTLHGCLRQEGHWQGEIWNRRKNGEIYPGWQTITAVTTPDGRVTHYVSAFSDISKSKEAEKQIINLAFYDPLTQLPNRRLLIDRLQQALVANIRNKCQGALLFVDLDKFKELNDTYGYDIGDLLLEVTASRLKACIRESDTAARLGGDEFIVLLENLDPDEPTAATQAETVGEKILKSIRQPYNLKGREYYTTASIGATLLRGALRTSDEMFRRSDVGLYQAKIAGRNTMHFYDPALQALVMARVAIVTDLRNAVGQPQSQFVLYYQAQVDVSGNLIGAEALVRWQHRERGLVSPAEFIPLAEETGLILPLGHWVLETACAQLAKWQNDSCTRHLQLAVNVSARQFHQPDFVEQVCAVLQKTAINPGKLKLELTESMLLNDIADVISKMCAIKKMGLRFSMDDFGTGYSSLAYLSKLPLSQLKIDQSFVRNLDTNTSDTVIVQTIIGMAHNLGMEVIAEGVETEMQRKLLEQNGCLLYQGYLFNKPVPLAEFEHLAGRSNIGQTEWHGKTQEAAAVQVKPITQK